MDLSLIAGLNLTEEQMSAINAASAADVTAATASLVNKNNDLLGEKDQRRIAAQEKDLELDSARAAAVTAEEQRLKLSGDMDGLKLHYETQLAETTATSKASEEKATKALDQYHRGSALNSALDLIHVDYKDLAKAQLSNMLKISYNDAGEAITTFEHDGKVVANNVGEFGSWASEQSAFKKILNGVDSSGAGVTPSHGGSATNQNDALNNLSQRLKSHGIT